MIATVKNSFPDPDRRGFITYKILLEGETEARELVYNTGRELLVGKNFVDEKDPDIFVINKKNSMTQWDIDFANVYVDEGNYYRVDCKNEYAKYDDKGNKTVVNNSFDWVHRVILFSFDGKYDSSREDVEHMDRNKSNNKLENLRAVPKLYNVMKEFKYNNYNASKYLGEITKKVTYENFIESALLALQDEGYTVIPPKGDK